MEKPWELNGDNVLVLSDAHQRVDWVKAVLEREAGNFDAFLFNGDMIDSHFSPPEVSGARETGRFYSWLINNYHVNIGNHELPVMESWSHHSRYSKKRPLINAVAGFGNNKAMEFNKELTDQQWEKVSLFRVVNGWLVSHAGFRENFWRPFIGIEENLKKLWEEAYWALRHIRFEPNVLFRMGKARTDYADTWGGPVWLDWKREFLDSLPIPQLVGHTHEADIISRIGRSYNIDTGSAYAIIKRDGTIEFKTLKALKVRDSEGEKIWVGENPVIRDDDNLVLKRNESYSAI